jgi:L,D-transpeptidase catalytic domain/Putative peptidoglycan binding domain
VRRAALAGFFALALAAAGLLAAAVASGARPLSVVTTTGTTTTATTTEPLIAAGVTIGGVPVGGMTAADAYNAVAESFSQPLLLIVRGHRLAPEPAQLGASARIGEVVARAGSASPGTQIPLSVSVKRARVRSYIGRVAKRFDVQPVDAQLYLRNLRPWIAKPVFGLRLYRTRAEAAIVGALVANKRGPLRLRQKMITPAITRTNFGPVIVIRRGSNRLHLYRGMQPWRVFPIATGQASYPTPLGRFRIVVKWRNPWWYPPKSQWAQGLKPVPPGPGNPLGTRWMGLSAPGVGIHGTPDAASIGYSASHGCIRMRIPEAEWLFRHVRIGTTVFIVSA